MEGKVCFVSGFVPIRDHPRTASEYARLGAALSEARVSLRVFHSRLSDCWLHAMLADLPFAVTHSQGDNPAKNSLSYHIVNHQKTAWLLAAALEDPEPDIFVWIDYGILHLPSLNASFIEDFARAVAADPPARITMPGCWNMGPVADAFPCWRFCGAVLISPRRQLHQLDQAVRAETLRCLTSTRNVPWEVNTWARVELSGDVPIDWYPADHDQTMFTNYGKRQGSDRTC